MAIDLLSGCLQLGRLIHPAPHPSLSCFGTHRCSARRFRSNPPRAGFARAYVALPGIAGNSYNTLGLDRGASEQEVKKAYRRLALQFHPDVCKGEYCTLKFMQISDAYESLMDLLRRGNGGEVLVDSYPEEMMGVNDDSWEDWEEWMGWEGAGTRDYTSHINDCL